MMVENILLTISIAWMFLWVYCLIQLVKEERKVFSLLDENSILLYRIARLSTQLQNKKDLIEIQEKIIGDYEKKDN